MLNVRLRRTFHSSWKKPLTFLDRILLGAAGYCRNSSANPSMKSARSFLVLTPDYTVCIEVKLTVDEKIINRIVLVRRESPARFQGVSALDPRQRVIPGKRIIN